MEGPKTLAARNYRPRVEDGQDERFCTSTRKALLGIACLSLRLAREDWRFQKYVCDNDACYLTFHSTCLHFKAPGVAPHVVRICSEHAIWCIFSHHVTTASDK